MSPKLRSYELAEFLPGLITPPNVLNLWRGWKYPDYPETGPDEPNGPPWCDLFLKHMRENMCAGNEQIYQYLLGWLADAVQNPHQTSRIALVMRGPQGSGKSLFTNCIADLFSPYTAILNRPEQLTGQFNKHLMDKCMVFADEAFFAGNRQQAAALKTLVTSEEILVEPKGVDSFMAPKRFRLMIASNDEHVIRAEGDDRRFLVLTVDAKQNNNNHAYFMLLLSNGRKEELEHFSAGFAAGIGATKLITVSGSQNSAQKHKLWTGKKT